MTMVATLLLQRLVVQEVVMMNPPAVTVTVTMAMAMAMTPVAAPQQELGAVSQIALQQAVSYQCMSQTAMRINLQRKPKVG